MMKKRIMSFALAVILCLPMLAPAYAAEAAITPQAAADYLYERGLFKGAGTGQDGKPIYNLDRIATRGEGITMFVRLLGKEEEANSNATSNSHTMPFTDVPAWANGYVGYAYTNGLTKGTSNTTFTPNNNITAYEFITLCLRALGYKEGVDFTWDVPRSLAAKLGLIGENGWKDNTQPFARADMVILAYNTLFAQKANSGTLADDVGLEEETYVPITDMDGATVQIKEVDAGDKSNLLPADDGKYYLPIGTLPEGTLIAREDMVYTSGAGNENVTNFANIISEMDPNASFSKNNIMYSGGRLVNITSNGSNWVVKSFNWDTGAMTRNMTLTAMTYFGDKDMAKAVYGMVDEFYRFRSDKTIPITTELAAKYGLTISNGVTGIDGSITATVSNGSSTWTIIYVLQNEANSLGSTLFKANIPIR